MKKTYGILIMATMMLFGLFMPGLLSAEKFIGEDIKIVSAQPPQYIGYRLTGTTGATSVYYKVNAVVTGVGATRASNVLTVDDANATISATNSVQIIWSRVIDATSYNVYKSTSSTSTYFYLLGNVAQGTYVLNDIGQTIGAAYSAPTVVGGNLITEGDVTVGDDLSVAGDVAGTTGSFSGMITVTAATVKVSSSATSTEHGFFAGFFETLPTTGYEEGTIAYQGSDNKVYIATEAVSEAGSWDALN